MHYSFLKLKYCSFIIRVLFMYFLYIFSLIEMRELLNIKYTISTQYRGLRYFFKRQILRGQYCAVNLRIRNDIAALILAGIVALPSWDLVSSGIAEDIIDLLSAIEYGTTKIWTENVKFSDNDEDLFFKKTLLLIIAHLADIDVYVFVKYPHQFCFINF